MNDIHRHFTQEDLSVHMETRDCPCRPKVTRNEYDQIVVQHRNVRRLPWKPMAPAPAVQPRHVIQYTERLAECRNATRRIPRREMYAGLCRETILLLMHQIEDVYELDAARTS